MSRVLTNNTVGSYVRETSIGVAATSGWRVFEYNTINNAGATLTTVARRPVSKSRQRAKGTVTDLDSAVEFETDWTMDAFVDFAEAFCFCDAANDNLVFKGANAVTNGYTIPAATASQGTKLQLVASGHASLIYAQGYVIAANNGLKYITTDVASTNTSIVATGQSIVAETAAGSAILEVAGVRGKGDDLSIVVSGTTAVITSAADFSGSTGFTNLGLTLGQFIHVGGTATANQFGAGASIGFGRLTAFTAATLTLDKISTTLISDDGSGDTVDLLFSRFIRNVSVDAAAQDTYYREYSHSFELLFQDLGGVGTPKYSYPKGNYANTLKFNLPLANKATIAYGFVGTDTPNPTASRATGPSTAVSPIRTTALNTSADIARLSTTGAAAASTYFKSMTLTLNNNVTPEKVLGTLGAAFMNAGVFEVSFEAQMIFADSTLKSAIRSNTTLTLDFLVKNANSLDAQQGVFIDIPSFTLGGGNLEFPQDQSLLINVTGAAFRDGTFGTSIGISLFPILPT